MSSDHKSRLIRVILSRQAKDLGAGDGDAREPRSFLRQDDTITRRGRLLAAGVGLVLLLAGCAASPEAARVRGEPGADPGNHGNPVELLAPPDRVQRVYYGIPYDGPSVASEDTSQS